MDPVSMIVLFTVLTLTLLITIGIITFIAKRRSDSRNASKLEEFHSEDEEELLQQPKKNPSPFNQLVWRVFKDLFADHKIAFPEKGSVARAELKEDVLQLVDKNAIVLQPANLSEQTFRHLPEGVSFKGVLTVGEKIQSVTTEEDIMKVPASDDSTEDDDQPKPLEITVTTAAGPK